MSLDVYQIRVSTFISKVLFLFATNYEMCSVNMQKERQTEKYKMTK